MQFITERFKRYDLLFLMAALLAVIYYVRVADGGFPLDDSWIHQVYGRNLAQTGQWAFVPGVPSAASTSPLYTVLLSIGYKLNIPFKLWTYGLGVIALWITGMVGARMAERIFSKPSPLTPLPQGEGRKSELFMPKHKYIGFVTGLALVLAWHLIWAAASGMETMLFGMWTLVLVWLAQRELDERSIKPRDVGLRGGIFGVLAALATLTRPEGMALAGLIGLMMLIGRPQKSWREFWLWSVGVGVGFALAIMPYLVLNVQLTGGLLPDTAAAKQAENAPLLADSYLQRIWNMVQPITAGGQILLLPGIICFAVVMIRQLSLNRKVLFHLLPVMWAVGLILLYAARLPAYYQHGRYVIPALPSLITIGVVGTFYLVQSGRNTVTGRVLSRSLAIAAALAFVYFALIPGAGVYRQDVRIIDEEMVTAAQWIADNISPEELLAVHDIGAVGYFAPRPILDLAGLVSPEIVPFINEEVPLWNWLYERGAKYLMAFPDQIPGDDTDDIHLCPLYITGGTTSPAAGGPNMAVYRLTWDGIC